MNLSLDGLAATTKHLWYSLRVIKILVYGAVLCSLLGLSFGVGLYAGAERNALFRFVRDLKTTIDTIRTGTRSQESSQPVHNARYVVHRDAASFARAQSEGTPPSNYLAWTGFYRIVTAEKDLGGFRPLNPWLPPVIAARLQPWARAKIEATDGVAEDTGQICQPTGMFRTTGFSGSFLFLPSPDKIVIAYGALETAGVQRVYLNRTHPRNLLPTWNGDSIGYWEGDTLVVDTIGFNDKSWLHPTMEPHTEEAHFIQRFRQVGDGAFIEVHYTVEDRKALTSAYTYSRYYRKVGESMPEDVCNDDLQMWRDFRNAALNRQLGRAQTVLP